MKAFRFWHVIALSAVLTLTSCKDDEKPPLTQAEAEAALVASTIELNVTDSEFETLQFPPIYDLFWDIAPANFILPDSFEPSPVSSISQPEGKDGSPMYPKVATVATTFPFSNFVGTWTYHPATAAQQARWVRTNTPTDAIVFNFPYPITTPTNNVLLTFYDYRTASVAGLGNVVTGLKRRMEIANQVVFTHVFTANITSSTNWSIRDEFTAGRFTLLEEYSKSLTNNNVWNITDRELWRREGKTIMDITHNGTYTVVNSDQVRVSAQLNAIISNIELRANFNFTNNQLLSATTPDALNLLASMPLYHVNGAKLGELKFGGNNLPSSWNLWVHFNNGEMINLGETYPLINADIREYIQEIFGYSFYFLPLF